MRPEDRFNHIMELFHPTLEDWENFLRDIEQLSPYERYRSFHPDDIYCEPEAIEQEYTALFTPTEYPL